MEAARNTNLSLGDKLAIERTKLAVERTFLAYFRSAIFFFATGLGIIKIHFLKQLDFLGILLIVLSPLLLFVGVFSLIKANRNIKNYIKE